MTTEELNKKQAEAIEYEMEVKGLLEKETRNSERFSNFSLGISILTLLFVLFVNFVIK